jgi:hypothetical protein
MSAVPPLREIRLEERESAADPTERRPWTSGDPAWRAALPSAGLASAAGVNQG